ncbi:MAG: RNA methyltransferase [bacterium]|nr:RNA methyltransferase [bacterium]
MKHKPLSKQAQKETTSLLVKKYRLQKNQTLAEGSVVVKEALNSNWVIHKIIVTQSWLKTKETHELFPLFSKRGVIFETIEDEFAKKISDLKTPPHVFAILSPPETQNVPNQGLIIALDRIADPNNLGAIARNAVFFGVQQIWLSENCVDYLNPKAIRSSMGGLFHLSITVQKSLANALVEAKKKGKKIVVADANQGTNETNLVQPNQTILVLGSESQGVTNSILEIADIRWKISPLGRDLSLNVAATSAILLDRLLSKYQ